MCKCDIFNLRGKINRARIYHGIGCSLQTSHVYMHEHEKNGGKTSQVSGEVEHRSQLL